MCVFDRRIEAYHKKLIKHFYFLQRMKLIQSCCQYIAVMNWRAVFIPIKKINHKKNKQMTFGRILVGMVTGCF